jgi:hypothetical protein
MSFRQHALKQGGFTGTQKPSQDGCGNQSHKKSPKERSSKKSNQERSVSIYPITDQGEDGLCGQRFLVPQHEAPAQAILALRAQSSSK